MSDDLADLPLKSLELPTKTVAKLKPLAIKTVRDLYARTAAQLAEAGLGERELAEIAEAASTFGITWSAGPAPVAAAAQAAPAPAPRPPKPRVERTAKALALPADVVEAFSRPASRPLGLGEADLAVLDPYVDASGRGFRTPPPSPALLRLVRRIAVVRGATIGGPERNFVVALIDVSQLPGASETRLMHLSNLFADVLVRIGVKPRAQSLVGCAAQLTITEKDAPKARALAAEHARWIGDGPPFLAPVPPALAAWAEAGLAVLTSG